MINSVETITDGPQPTNAANQSSGSRMMLKSSCMALFSIRLIVNGNDLEVVPQSSQMESGMTARIAPCRVITSPDCSAPFQGSSAECRC